MVAGGTQGTTAGVGGVSIALRRDARFRFLSRTGPKGSIRYELQQVQCDILKLVMSIIKFRIFKEKGHLVKDVS